MLGQHRNGGATGYTVSDPLSSTQGIYVVVDDPDLHYERAEADGAQIVVGLTDQDYGSREYSARPGGKHMVLWYLRPLRRGWVARVPSPG
jgi:predicted enzyme related to lactoylglutathione lyase